MQLNITARHLDLTPALSGYVHRKVEKAQRYFDSVIWAQAILAVEKHRHIVELVVHTPGSTFRTKGEAGDLYSAVDLAAHKLDVHLSRVKDKKRSNHRAHLKDRLDGVPESSEPLLSAAGMEKSVETPIQVHKVELKLLSTSKAIQDLNSNGHPVVLFLNSKTNRISACYRKGKNGYVILEGEE